LKQLNENLVDNFNQQFNLLKIKLNNEDHVEMDADDID
jgi:hypothetical protein